MEAGGDDLPKFALGVERALPWLGEEEGRGAGIDGVSQIAAREVVVEGDQLDVAGRKG